RSIERRTRHQPSLVGRTPTLLQPFRAPLAMMSNARRFLAVAAFGASVLAASPASTQASEFAAGLPTGPPYPTAVERPRDEPQRVPACSFRFPLCVHAGPEVGPDTVLGALADLERVAARFVAAGLPWPLTDGALGGSPGFDVYLVAPS